MKSSGLGDAGGGCVSPPGGKLGDLKKKRKKDTQILLQMIGGRPARTYPDS
jgi:hypothetical protein